MPYKTEQESIWAGDLGATYSQLNRGSKLLASNLSLFSKALKGARRLDSCIEFWANIGMNLKALQFLLFEQEQFAIELNPQAVKALGEIISPAHIHEISIFNFRSKRTGDLVLIKGVLIHISPEWLPEVYDTLYRAIGCYLLICKYYRSHSDSRELSGVHQSLV